MTSKMTLIMSGIMNFLTNSDKSLAGKVTNESLEDFKNRVPESKDYFAAQKIREDQIGGKEE